MNAASLTTLFKHIRGNVEEQNSDDLSRVKDLIREKVINFVRDKVRNHMIGYFVVSLIQKWILNSKCLQSIGLPY